MKAAHSVCTEIGSAAFFCIGTDLFSPDHAMGHVRYLFYTAGLNFPEIGSRLCKKNVG